MSVYISCFWLALLANLLQVSWQKRESQLWLSSIATRQGYRLLLCHHHFAGSQTGQH
ncbi:MAG: hypothetical protein ACRC62_08215 [Microcoleus sp.]